MLYLPVRLPCLLAVFVWFLNIGVSPGWELRTTVRGLGGEPLREYSTRGIDGWHWVRDYVYRVGGLLAAVEPNEQGGEDVFHFHLDHLGTPQQITNAGGVQVALHSYYPFGQEATVPTQTSFTKKFTGHERDANGTSTAGELDYMHARFGSPTLGRFLSFDPIGGNPHNPQSWNRYAYALNSPMNYTDPQGLFPALFFDLNFVFFDQITVTAARPQGFEIPSWILDNWFVDVSPHFDNSRFDFSQAAFPAWEGWERPGCDEWCQVFAQVGRNSQAASYLEAGISAVAMGAIVGPLFSRGSKEADDAVDAFRAVSRAEADDIARHGFRPDPSGKGFQEGKWFSETRAGAEAFRRNFSDLDEVVHIRVPRSVYDRSFRHPNIDNAGPGFCVQCADLPLLPSPR